MEMETTPSVPAGEFKNKNDFYYERANRLIPGGAHTYSKGRDQYPANAPKIISHGKGCMIWDVDGNQYIDLAMSLGSMLLGHGYEPVVKAVSEEIAKGVNFTRPSYLEGELAELLHNIIPSAEMVKLGKNGSDAVTAAVKLARAYTGRDYIVRCSSDPFNAIHDWFIGSTAMNRGVTELERKLTLQFDYNDIESLNNLFAKYPNQIACVVFEPISLIEPKPGFLQAVKDTCEKNGAILIFDEVVSGFRFSLGGAQELAGVTPHLSAFGKGMANGFPISALVGAREIMQIGGLDHDQERVFLLSTTHGGDTGAIRAAIVTINEIREKNMIPGFWSAGATLQAGIRKVVENFGLQKFIEVGGYGCKPFFAFRDHSGEISSMARTLFLQETMGRGLIMPYVVPGYSHTPEIIRKAVEIVEQSLIPFKKAVDAGDFAPFVIGPAIKPVFRKFN